jgi:hypothetical protein
MRPLCPPVNPSMRQSAWFPLTQLDELSELERLEKQMMADNEMIQNTVVRSPIGHEIMQGAATATTTEEEDEGDDGDDDEIGSLEDDSLEFDDEQNTD